MSSTKIDRRTALLGMGGSALAVWPAIGTSQPNANWHGFVVETGTRGWPDYAVGVLVCADPPRRLSYLRTLRSQALFKPGKHGYLRPLRYSSTDRHRMDFARLAMRHFSQRPDMYISMVCAGTMHWPDTAIARDAVQTQMYERMLRQIRPTFRNHLKLHVIRRTRNGRDLALLNTAKVSVGFVQSIDQAGHSNKDLMAVASLIVGSINAEQSRTITDASKLQLRSALRSYLQVATLRPALLNQTGKLRVLTLT